MEKEQIDTVELAIQVSKKVHALLGLSDGKNKAVVTLGVDLADITESCLRIPKMIRELQAKAEADDKEGVADMLVELETEFEHIQWHHKQAKRKIDKVADLLYGEDK